MDTCWFLIFADMLYRNNGVHGGKQVLSREWIDLSWPQKLASSRPRNRTPIGLKVLDKPNAFAQQEALTFLVVPVSYWFNPIIANRVTLELSTAR